MQICSKHWKMLRDEIENLGMTHLVGSGTTLQNQLEDELSGIPPESFDPLMYCNTLIWDRGLELFGLGIMGSYPEKEEGWGEEKDGTRHYCPVCCAMKNASSATDEISNGDFNTPGSNKIWDAKAEEEYWIKGPVKAAYQYCIEAGLLDTQDKVLH